MKVIKGKKIRISIFTLVVLIITLVIFISSIVLLFIAKDEAFRSRLVFNAIESVVMFILIFIPTIINKTTRLKIPKSIEILYMVFCAGSIILGEISDFYGKFFWWDSVLHAMSGVLLGALGYLIINSFNTYNGKEIKFSPIFVSIWVICFALAAGVVWELFEYMCDDLFGTNMQQFLQGTGTLDKGDPLVGHAALQDTMKDLFLDLIGSLITAVVGFVEMKRQKKGIYSVHLETEEEYENSKLK